MHNALFKFYSPGIWPIESIEKQRNLDFLVIMLPTGEMDTDNNKNVAQHRITPPTNIMP